MKFLGLVVTAFICLCNVLLMPCREACSSKLIQHGTELGYSVGDPRMKNLNIHAY
jgi:hypothetical protein